jgi:hypothetical protein
MQIEILIYEFSEKTKERTIIDDFIDANQIDHEYVEKYFYSIKNSFKLFIYL